MLPMTRDQWLEEVRLKRPVLPVPTEAEVIKSNADWLVERLYEPDAKVGCYITKRSIRVAGVDKGIFDEPINWGDLSASVGYREGTWRVTLEEAAGGECPILCAYIRHWLNAWGWEGIEVVTEW